jgi:RNA polymerase sigma factor (TIGR02999 family)
VSVDSLTVLLSRSRDGDEAARAELSATLYPHLRQMARRYLSRERAGHTLQTTELVHEAWLRLFGTTVVSPQDRAHLVALMATQMRRVLVDHARRRAAAKRPDSGVRIAFDDAQPFDVRRDEDVLAVHEALTELEAVDARAGRVVELRYFGGMLEREAADALGVSLATLKRDWTFARAWLFDRLSRGGGAAAGSADGLRDAPSAMVEIGGGAPRRGGSPSGPGSCRCHK